MKIIKPSVEFYGAVPTDYAGALRFIEMAGRTCYKSEDKITETSAEAFVRKLIKAGHLAMVEHSNMVVRCPTGGWRGGIPIGLSKYLTFAEENGYWYVGGNLTAWWNHTKESGCTDECSPFVLTFGDLFDVPDDLRIGSDWQLCPHDEIPKELHRYSAKFICDRGVSHELVRHRPCSFAQESTRYVNYAGKDMEFIEPEDFEGWPDDTYRQFMLACEDAETAYHYMVKPEGPLLPQQARAVLPNALKTEIVVTADVAEWQHLFNLRCAPSAHPDFRRLAVPLRDKFQEAGLI